MYFQTVSLLVGSTTEIIPEIIQLEKKIIISNVKTKVIREMPDA